MAKDSTTPTTLNVNEQELLLAFRQMDEEAKKHLMAIAKALEGKDAQEHILFVAKALARACPAWTHPSAKNIVGPETEC